MGIQPHKEIPVNDPDLERLSVQEHTPSRRCASCQEKNEKRQSFFCCTWPRKAAARFLRTSSCFLFASLLSGCGAIPPLHSEGRYLTTQHGTARFRDAMQGAVEYCAQRGMSVRHLGTDTPRLSISRFECIPQ